MKRKRAAALIGICLSGVLATAARGAAVNQTGYACQLVRAGKIGAAYEKGASVEKRALEVSEAYGEGTYTSGCRVKVAKKARNAAGRSDSRPRLGQLRIYSVVPAGGAAAGAWDPEKLNAGFLSGVEGLIANFGGEAFPMPAFGQTEAHAYWLGNKEFSAEAFWRRADAGFLTIELHDHAESIPRLERLLSLFGGGIVPGFSP